MANNRVDWLSPLGAGMSLFLDFSKNVKSSSGVNKVIEAMVGRLVDRLWYDDSYGIDLAKRLRGQNPLTYPSLASEVERELLKDDRVDSVNVSITYDANINHVTVTISGFTSSYEQFDFIGNLSFVSGDSLIFEF